MLAPGRERPLGECGILHARRLVPSCGRKDRWRTPSGEPWGLCARRRRRGPGPAGPAVTRASGHGRGAVTSGTGWLPAFTPPRHRLTPAEADMLRLQPVKGNHGSSCLPGPEAWWRGVATASWGPEEPAPTLPCNSGNLLFIWEKDRGRRGWPPPPPTHPANDRRLTSASHKQTTPMRAARLPRRCEGPCRPGVPGRAGRTAGGQGES